MRDWVKPYILQKTASYVDGFVKDGSEKEQWLALKSKALQDAEILSHELTLCLNCHFGRELGDPQEFFNKVFGSVLADLPEEVFKKLTGMKNLFFTYNPSPGGELKVFELEHGIPPGNHQMVTFSYSSGFLPPPALRGQIALELAKVYKGLGDIHGQEDQVDSIAIEWGFGEEIKAAKLYKKEMVSEKRRNSLVIGEKVATTKTRESPRLITRGEKGAQKRVHEIRKKVTSIGRNPNNDVVLKDPYVSNYHARISQEDGGYFIYDCESKNGTRVNGQNVHRKRVVDVDIIEIGRSTFVFLSKDSSSDST